MAVLGWIDQLGFAASSTPLVTITGLILLHRERLRYPSPRSGAYLKSSDLHTEDIGVVSHASPHLIPS